MKRKIKFLGYKEIKAFPKVPFIINGEIESNILIKGDDKELMRKIILFQNRIFR